MERSVSVVRMFVTHADVIAGGVVGSVRWFLGRIAGG